jgi:RNA polymerase sigma-70 factor (ECF subfamily)
METVSGNPHVEDEAPLLAQARAGSQAAFTELVRLCHRSVRAYLSQLVRSADVVDDLAQEVFLHAYQDLGAYTGPAPVLAWLLGIARNRALQHLRSEARRLRREGRHREANLADWRGQLAETDAAEPDELERQLAALHDCLGRLPAHSRQIIHDRYFARQSAEAIAARLGKKANSVRMLLLRIRRGLADCIHRKLGGEEH